MTIVNSPIRTPVHILTGGWDRIEIPSNVNTFACQTRDQSTYEVRRPGASGYFSMFDGKTLTLNCYNFSNDYIDVKGTAGSVLEIIEFIRE